MRVARLGALLVLPGLVAFACTVREGTPMPATTTGSGGQAGAGAHGGTGGQAGTGAQGAGGSSNACVLDDAKVDECELAQ